jgi:hypothetical protein
MLIINYLVCLVRGHAFSTITYKVSTYQYCLQCGKVESHINNREELSQRVEVNPLYKQG